MLLHQNSFPVFFSAVLEHLVLVAFLSFEVNDEFAFGLLRFCLDDELVVATTKTKEVLLVFEL